MKSTVYAFSLCIVSVIALSACAPEKSSTAATAPATQVEATTSRSTTKAKPRLILQITVDALRSDLPKRYAHMLGDGGFRYLMAQGIDYTNAHYQHANTETIVGHVSLARDWMKPRTSLYYWALNIQFQIILSGSCTRVKPSRNFWR